MTSVKWLRRVTAVAEPFEGFQMDAYRVRQSPEEPGTSVSRIQPRSLMIAPGFPEFLTRVRHVQPGVHTLAGRAWSGWAPIERVEVSTDGGSTWSEATLGEQPSRYAWVYWTHDWEARPGEHELCSRATDAAGNVQPFAQSWNYHGLSNNAVQRIRVLVGN